MKRFFVILGYTIVIIFALIGLATTGVFVAMRFDLLNVRGSIDERNEFFFKAYQENVGKNDSSSNSANITTDLNNPPSEVASDEILNNPCLDLEQTVCNWTETPEWSVISSGLQKDEAILNRVEAETGIKKRLIASVILPEQARFFSSNREVFKRWFEPMKLLGSLSQFSLGVSGIKQETAVRIEEYANDSTSPFFPDANAANLLKYDNIADKDAELFKRLTDEDNHYYSYLYTALYIKEVIMQWERAGFDISNRPEVIVTLFNLGFDKSIPHANPTAGGAVLNIGNTDYTYGALGGLFYYSDELSDTFPK